MNRSLHEHLDKNNLHHAYLIEGVKDEIVPEIFGFFENLNIKTSGNPDFCHITIDNFKIDEAFELRGMSTNKSYSSLKKIFLITVNSFTLDAQNVLLKMFEEPIENTHFFLIVPDANSLLKTLVSRFYFISTRQDSVSQTKDAEKFISMALQDRINFIKDLLVEEEDGGGEGNEIIVLDSTRSKATKFLNELESVLHHKIFIQGKDKNPKENPATMIPFRQIFLVRKFLRQPGSSTKTLMESVALVIPDFDLK